MSGASRLLAALPCVLVAAAACDPKPAPKPPERSLADLVLAELDRMHARFASAKSIQVAIAVADLERAHSEARSLAAASDPDLLPDWRPFLDGVRAAATDVATTKDTIGAARASARLGAACARCHLASKARVVFPREDVPALDGKLGDRMMRHQWAAAQMWQGLIGPDDSRWQAGARELADAPLTITAESGELGIADDVARTRALATRAMRTGDQLERSGLYGDLLASCAHCHATIRQP